jgi:endonuclease/exonuclease/phosphatase family metal-dependent hydrolase
MKKFHILFAFIAVLLALTLAPLFGCAGDDDDDNDASPVDDDDTTPLGDDDDNDDNDDDDNDDNDDDATPPPAPNDELRWGEYLCPEPSPTGVEVRMGTFNLHGGGESDAAGIAAGLSAHLPFDLLALQECPADFATDIAVALGMEVFFFDGRALLSFTPLTDTWGYAFPSGRSVAHGVTEIGGVEVSAYAAHVGWNDEGDWQCREFIDDLLAVDPIERVLVGGDLNDEPGSTQFAILDEVMAASSSSLGIPPPYRVSWPATAFYGSEGQQLIDHILFNKSSGGCATEGEIVNFTPPLSDHKPAFATVLFPDELAPSPPQLLDVVFGLAPDSFGLLFDKPIATATVELDDEFGPVVVSAVMPLERGYLVEVAHAPLAHPAEVTAHVTAATDIDGNELPAPVALSFTYFANRLENAGGESGVQGWTTDGIDAFDENWNVEPLVGEAFFAGGSPFKARSYATQTVALDLSAEELQTGRAMLEFGGASRTGYMMEEISNVARSCDEAEVVLDVLDATGAWLVRYNQRRLDTLYWQPWRRVVPLPPDAAQVVVTLRAMGGMFGLLYNSASFDALHLAPMVLAENERHGLLGPNLVGNALFLEGTDGWDVQGFAFVGADQWLGPISPVNVQSFSGDYWLAALVTGQAVVLEQELDTLDFPIDQGELTIRWSGAARSLFGHARVSLRLACLDSGGQVLAEQTLADTAAAEWFNYEGALDVPSGTAKIVYTWRADPGAQTDVAFFDVPVALPYERDALENRR